MFTNNDINLLEERFDDIINEISIKRANMFGPTEDDIVNINKIIHDYIKLNRRKIYGGYALDLLVKNKGKMLYDNKVILKTPDIDFYSHEPIKDLIKLCNLLDDAGFSYVMGKEAMHKETYSITVNMKLFCDITYVPVNINKTIPFNIIDDYHIVSPLFMSIDYLRILSDPITSYWRIKKSFDRFALLTDCYPLNDIIKKNPNIKIDEKYIKNQYNKSFSYKIRYDIDVMIMSFLVSNKSCVSVGPSSMQYFLNEIETSSKTFDDIFCHQIISTDYANDIAIFIDIISKSFLKNDLSYEEHRPYFQFTGNSMHIKYLDTTVLKIYSSNNKCIPYHEVDTPYSLSHGKTIKIGTYSLVLKSLLVELMTNRTSGDKHLMSTYYHVVEYFVDIRKKYFELNQNKNVFSESLFKEFSLNCIGVTLSPELERKHLIENRKKTGKKLTFIYEPKDNHKDPADDSYYFANSSGNKIILKQQKINDAIKETSDDAIKETSDEIKKST